MGLWDKIGSLADRFGVRSEGYTPQEQQTWEDAPYDDYAQPAEAPYTPPAGRAYEEAPPQDAYDDPYYESSYTAGGGYVSAGVRPRTAPRSKKPNPITAFIQRVRNSGQEEYIPEAPLPDNVVPMSGYAEDAQGYESARQYGQPRYREAAAEEPEAPVRGRHQGTTMIYLVRRLEDAEEIIGFMLEGGNVIVNMEEIDEALKQRVLDMVSGAAFALDCSIKRISFRNYFIAPSGEEIVTNTAVRESRDRDRDRDRDGRDSRDRDRYRDDDRGRDRDDRRDRSRDRNAEDDYGYRPRYRY